MKCGEEREAGDLWDPLRVSPVKTWKFTGRPRRMVTWQLKRSLRIDPQAGFARSWARIRSGTLAGKPRTCGGGASTVSGGDAVTGTTELTVLRPFRMSSFAAFPRIPVRVQGAGDRNVSGRGELPMDRAFSPLDFALPLTWAWRPRLVWNAPLALKRGPSAPLALKRRPSAPLALKKRPNAPLALKRRPLPS